MFDEEESDETNPEIIISKQSITVSSYEWSQTEHQNLWPALLTASCKPEGWL